MKKLIALFLAVMMILPLAGCGGSKDKEKLIGTWKYHIPFYTNTTINNDKWYGESILQYDFYSDNTFRYESFGYAGFFVLPKDQWETRVHYGKYTIKDGMITLKYDGGKLGDEEIPYHINEYTKELMFDVKTDGTSDWSKTSSTPKQYDD